MTSFAFIVLLAVSLAAVSGKPSKTKKDDSEEENCGRKCRMQKLLQLTTKTTTTTTTTTTAAPAHSVWTYTEATHWSDQYPTCKGDRQSPVNLVTAEAVHDDNLVPFTLHNFFALQGVQCVVVNNGHAAQVTYQSGPLSVTGGALGGAHTVVQYHFHWGSDDLHGSEHTMDGVSYPMEMHVVTFNQKYENLSIAVTQPDGLAVLGFFFEISPDDNADIEPLCAGLKNVINAGTESVMPPTSALGDMLPSNLTQYYRYQGGLTTPPCSESVVWTVFKQTIPISERQINAFRALKSRHADATGANEPLMDNYRPAQPLMGRTILTSI